MNNNETILQSIISSVSAQTLSVLVATTGESESVLKSALTTTIPVVLGALIGESDLSSDNSPSPSSQEMRSTCGLSKVLGSVSQLSSAYGIPTGRTGTSLDALVEDPSHLFREMSATGTPAQSVIPQMLTQLFGTQADQTVRILANLCGLKISSMTSLLAFTIPLVFSRLSGPLSRAGVPFNVASLSTLLTTIAPQVSNALPSGLASMLSLGGVLNSFSHSSTAESTGMNASSTARGPLAAPSLTTKSGVPFAPLMTGLVLLGGAWYLWKSASPSIDPQQESVVVSSAQVAKDSATPKDREQLKLDVASSGPATAESDAARAMLGHVAATGSTVEDSIKTPVLTTLPLPNGASVAGVAGMIESQLIAAISSTNPSLDPSAWYDFDRLNFEVGSSALSASSQEQIQNIAAILTAYPTTRIKIGGYTDASGDEASNMALSERRAQAVKIAVVQSGIDESRIEAEGYGSHHPLASDSTAEGRSLNRRIALRLISK